MLCTLVDQEISVRSRQKMLKECVWSQRSSGNEFQEKPDGQTSNADDAIRAVDGILQIDTDIVNLTAKFALVSTDFMESIIMPIEKKCGLQQIGFCVILHHTCVNRWLQYSMPPFERGSSLAFGNQPRLLLCQRYLVHVYPNWPQTNLSPSYSS